MTATRSAAEIAATLTKAQRRALLWLPQDRGERGQWPKGSPRADVLDRMQHAGLTSFHGCDYWRLTALGAEVRAILASTEPSNADG